MAHSRYLQFEQMTNMLIAHYKYATLASNGVAREKIAVAEKLLRRYKIYYFTLER